jgi:hypothetical protein
MKKILRALLAGIGFLGLFMLVSCGDKAVKAEGAAVSTAPAVKLEAGVVHNGTFDMAEIKKYEVYNSLSQDFVNQVAAAGYWQFITGFGGDGKVSIEKGVCKVTIANPGKEIYSVQLVQIPVFVEKNKTYTVKFDAKADAPRSLITKVGMVGGDWRAYSGDQKFDITKEMKTYTYTFTAISEDKKARMDFNLGQNSSSVYLANVVMSEMK